MWKHYLEEQDKADPLVVGVVFFGVVVVEVVCDAGGSHGNTNLALEGVRHGEGAGDPAVSVDDMGGQPADDALNGVADELVGGDDQ